MNGRLASNTPPLIIICGAVFVGVVVCGSNILPLLIVYGLGLIVCGDSVNAGLDKFFL